MSTQENTINNEKKRKLKNQCAKSTSTGKKQITKKRKINNSESKKKYFSFYLKTLSSFFRLLATEKSIEPVKDYVFYNQEIEILINNENKREKFTFSLNEEDYRIYYCIRTDDRIKEREVNDIIRKEFKKLHCVKIESIDKVNNVRYADGKKNNNFENVKLSFKFLPLSQVMPLNSTTMYYRSINSNLVNDNSDFLNYYQDVQMKSNSNRKKKYFYIFVEFQGTKHEDTYSSAIIELVLYKGSQTYQGLYNKKYPEFLNSFIVQDYYYNDSSDKNELKSQTSSPLLTTNNIKKALLPSSPKEITIENLFHCDQNTIVQSPVVSDLNINSSLQNLESLPYTKSDVPINNNQVNFISNDFSPSNTNNAAAANTMMLNYGEYKNNTPIVMSQASTVVNNSGVLIPIKNHSNMPSILQNQFLPSPTLDTTTSLDTRINTMNTNISMLLTSLPSPQNNTFSDQVYKFNPTISGGLLDSNPIVNTYSQQLQNNLSPICFPESAIYSTIDRSTHATINLYNNYNCQYQSNNNIYPPYVQSPKSVTEEKKTIPKINISSITINECTISSSRNTEKKKVQELILDEQSSKNLFLEINCINEIDKHREYFSSNGLLLSYYSIIKKGMGKTRDNDEIDDDTNSSNESETFNSEDRIKRVFEAGSKANFIHSSPYIIGDNTTLLYNSKLGRNNTYYFFVISNGDKVLFISELVTIKTYRRSKSEKNKTTKKK
ncbi:hypothetical protein BCR36DRAFT_460077 [Piromyces finnis]|uniref:Uncharacterized protein n=1 Tax=Piromyces finnis TaxID=1754191 RepID=A0A1Y1V088_9FUNG|nr:hypothetical protein BCR36DRAFT_460077 [Piromyces finnis]|eukprot:ORX43827.1 hypothetical protein BCR36DRAFT_460077 [Piromyces finnis]